VRQKFVFDHAKNRGPRNGRTADSYRGQQTEEKNRQKERVEQ
jgi:hypothetical protein